MMHLYLLLPELAQRETRDITILPPERRIPPGRYSFIETYCQDPDCDCRRVLLKVFSHELKQTVATIGHSFEPPGPDDLVPEQTFLDPISQQSKWSKAILEVFLTQVLDDVYAERLVRHYEAVKAAVKDPDDPIHERIPPTDNGFVARKPGSPWSPGSSRWSGSSRWPGSSRSAGGGIPLPPPRRGKKKWR